jgi:hypothetical protein
MWGLLHAGRQDVVGVTLRCIRLPVRRPRHALMLALAAATPVIGIAQPPKSMPVVW